MLHSVRHLVYTSQHFAVLPLSNAFARWANIPPVSLVTLLADRRWTSDQARSDEVAEHIKAGQKGFRPPRWTTDEDAVLRRAVDNAMTSAQIAAKVLPARTHVAIAQRRKVLKLEYLGPTDTASKRFISSAQKQLGELDETHSSGRDERQYKPIEDEILKEARMRMMPIQMIRKELFPGRSDNSLMYRLRVLFPEADTLPKTMRPLHAWTADDDEILRAAVARGLSDPEIVTQVFSHRSVLSVRERRRRLSLSSQHIAQEWTDRDQELMEKSARQGMFDSAIHLRVLQHHSRLTIRYRRMLSGIKGNIQVAPIDRPKSLSYPTYSFWTDDETRQLTDAARQGLSNSAIHKTLLPNRTVATIAQKRRGLGLPHFVRAPRNPSFEGVDQRLRELVTRGLNAHQILRLIPSLKNEKSVRTRLRTLGLHDSLTPVPYERVLWTKAEKALLFDYNSQGMSVIDIADRLRRSVGSVEQMLWVGSVDWPVSHKRWTKEEDQEILKLLDERRSIHFIAERIGRTVQATIRRSGKLKKRRAQGATTNDI